MKQIAMLLCAIVYSQYITAQGNNQSINNYSTKEVTMSAGQTAEKNKAIIKQLFDECFNKGNLELLNELVTTGFTVENDNTSGPAGFANVIKGHRHSFPDIKYTITQMVAEEDRVAVSWNWTGTHQAAFRYFDATGNRVTNHGMAIFTLKNAKISSIELETDRLGFLQAIGIIPQDLNELKKLPLQK